MGGESSAVSTESADVSANTRQDTPGFRIRLRQRTMLWGERAYISLYRLLRGRVVAGWSAGAPVALVTTTGRRTGLPRTVALGHLRVDAGILVAGTNGGLPRLPHWVRNLEADPHCVVEARSERFEAKARFLQGTELEEHWSRLVSAYPIYAQAPAMTGRQIPLILLTLEA